MISAWWLVLVPIAALVGWCTRVGLDRDNCEGCMRTIDERPNRVIITEANHGRLLTATSCGHASHNWLPSGHSQGLLELYDSHTTGE
jgi:hypothetical protein